MVKNRELVIELEKSKDDNLVVYVGCFFIFIGLMFYMLFLFIGIPILIIEFFGK